MFQKIQHKNILVIAGNHQEFNDFCRFRLIDFEKGIKDEQFPYNSEFIYYSSSDSIRGILIDEVLNYGTFYIRDDVDYDDILSSSRRGSLSWKTYRERKKEEK